MPLPSNTVVAAAEATVVLAAEVSVGADLEQEALLVGTLAVASPAVVLLVTLLAPALLVVTLSAVVLRLASRAEGSLAVTLAVEASSTAFEDGASRGAFCSGRHSAMVSDMARTVITTTRAMRGRRTATPGFAVTTTGTEFVSTQIMLTGRILTAGALREIFLWFEPW
jgi:hypothetical protein